jgi:hypothetical protein
MSIEQLLRDAARDVDHSARTGGNVEIAPRRLIGSIRDAVDSIAVTHHPLGFYHFELSPLVSLENVRVRLHIWSEQAVQGRDELGLVHEHTWDLASCVLVGALTDRVLHAQIDPAGDHRRVIIDYTTGLLEEQPGRFRISETTRRRVGIGKTYFLVAGNLHETAIEEFPTATLVVARETGRTAAEIFSPGGLDDPRGSDRRPVPATVAARELAALLG